MLNTLQHSPIIPLFYHPDAQYAKKVMAACYAGGVRAFELTNRGAAAFEVFTELRAFANKEMPDLLLGIGTIYAPDDAVRFIHAGAAFVVQPVTTELVGDVCKQLHIPWIPGAMTMNEIWDAWTMGATMVKIFPGTMVGPQYIRALRGPMPDVPLMITGGVEPETENVNAWLSAGVQAVGIGSQLFKGDFQNNPGALTDRLKHLLSNIPA
jgi:2-dehydro-3-deoxyphosphogluconate aldolase/(4S)-4-hydroxy-2-oxoglutarate aldolase